MRFLCSVFLLAAFASAQVATSGGVTFSGGVGIQAAPQTQYINMGLKPGALTAYPTFNFDSTNVENGTVSYDTSNAASLYNPTGYAYGMVINYTKTTSPYDGDINNYAIRTGMTEGALLPDMWISGYIRRHQNSAAATKWGQGKIFRWIDAQDVCTTSSISDESPDCLHGVLTTFPATFDGDTTKTMQLTFANHPMNATLCFSGCSTATNIVSSVTRASTTVTVTTSAPHGFLTSEKINASGCSDSSFNASGVAITATSSTTFTYTAGSGAGSSTTCQFFNHQMNANWFCTIASSGLCALQWDTTYKITTHFHFGTLTQNQTAASTDYVEVYVNQCTDGVVCSGLGTEVGQYMTNSTACPTGPCITVAGGIRLRPVTTGYTKSVTQIYLGNQWDAQDACGTPTTSGRAITTISQSGTTVTVNTGHTSCSGSQAAFINGWSVEISGVTNSALNQLCTNVTKVTQDQFTCTGAGSQTVSSSGGVWKAQPDISAILWGWKLGTSQASVAN